MDYTFLQRGLQNLKTIQKWVFISAFLLILPLAMYDKSLTDKAFLIAALFALPNIFQKYKLENIEKILLVFIGWSFTAALISYFANLGNGIKANGLEPYIRLLLCIPIFLSLKKYQLHKQWIFYSLLLAATTAFALALHQKFNLNQGRVFGPQNPVEFGSFAAILTLLLTTSISRKHSKNGLILIAVIFLLSVIMLTGTRGAILGIASLFVVIALTNPLKLTIKRQFIGYSSFLIIFVSGLTFTESNLERRFKTTLTESISYFKEDNSQINTGQRLELMLTGWCAFKENPFFGIGANNYKNVNTLTSCEGQFSKTQTLQAHSYYFNSLATQGILGGINFILLISLCFYQFKNWRKSIPIAGMLSIGLTIDLFYVNYVAIFYGIAAITTVYFSQKSTKVAAQT